MNNSNLTHPEINSTRGYLMCVLAAAFYLYSFAQRIMPSAITHELMLGFHIHAQTLGILVGSIYYGYMLMQIPVGLLFDRFQARILLTIAPLLCAIGAFLFASAHSVALAGLGGFIMGLGQAFSFGGVLIIAARVFPPQYFALIAGIVQSLGSIGAILGEIPMAWYTHYFGWRQSIFGIAFIGLILAIGLFILIKDPPPSKIHSLTQPLESIWQRLQLILIQTQNLWIALYAFMIWAPTIIFGGLWAIPYLMRLYHVSSITATSAAAWIWIGVGLGSPLFGWWSDRIGQRRLPLMVSAIIGFTMVIVILYVPDLSWRLMCAALFLLGIGGSGQTLSFAITKDNNPPYLAGTAVGFTNTAVVMGGVILQPLVGWLLHWRSNYVMQHGIPIYPLSDYHHSLTIAAICALTAFLISYLFIKETRAEPQHQL